MIDHWDKTHRTNSSAENTRINSRIEFLTGVLRRRLDEARAAPLYWYSMADINGAYGRIATLDPRKCCVCSETEFIADRISFTNCPKTHTFCRKCLQNMMRNAITDRVLYPVRCCGNLPIDLNTAGPFVGPTLASAYADAGKKWADGSRTYCFKCTKYLFRDTRVPHDFARVCPECNVWTCTSCGARAHNIQEGVYCRTNTTTAVKIEDTAAERIRACANCGDGIKKRCNRVECGKCGDKSCELCGKEWKKCQCPTYGV